MKKLWYSVGLVIGFVILIVQQWPSEVARMVACDVGQGDGILIIKGQTQVLIDGGPSSEKILACLENALPFWDRRIELIVMTNTDFDHMNGLSSVVDRYEVMQFVTSDGVHDSDALMKLVSSLGESKVGVEFVAQGDLIEILGQDELQFRVLWPPEVVEQYVAVFSDELDDKTREQILGASAKRGNLNERSVVLLLLEGTNKILLMGDAGLQAEEALIKSGLLSDVTHLKVGHHGSKYASSLEFLHKVAPEIAIISVGAKNRYGHPTNEALERLSKVGAVVRRTDEEGTIELQLN